MDTVVMTPPMDLDAAVARWRSAPFPHGSEDDEVDDLHADLAYWDAMVADTVIPMVKRGEPFVPGAVDIPEGLKAFLRETERPMPGLSEHDQERVAAYRAYATLLCDVYELASRPSRSGPNTKS